MKDKVCMAASKSAFPEKQIKTMQLADQAKGRYQSYNFSYLD